jgi:hypothetical protein
MLQFLIHHPKIDLNAADQDGNTALHLAAKANRAEVVEALLHTNAINFVAVNREGATADEVTKNQTIADLIKCMRLYARIDVV